MSKDATKVLVRLLPPEITEDELLGTFSEAHLKNVVWRSFQPGKRYKGEEKAARNARCYLNFATLEHSEQFLKDYHGHQFVDGRGEQFRAVACYAPYQKIPRSRVQRDPRDGTIEGDATYKEFVEALGQPKVFVAPENPKDSLRPDTPGNTPLLQHLKKTLKERRERAERKLKERKKWSSYSGMDQIAEEPRMPKWRCSECGTSRHLEEDPDDRGTFYCTRCWEAWESEPAPTSKSKKKKKHKAEKEEVVEYSEEYPSKKKKKKKKGKEAEDDADWWSTSTRHTDASHSRHGGSGEQEDGGERKSRKKKKHSEEYSEHSYSEDRYWSSRTKDEYWDPTYMPPDAESRRQKKSKYKESDSWWEDDTYQSRSTEKGSSGRWRAKATNEEEESGGGAAYKKEKHNKIRKEKKAKEDEEEGYRWDPKARH
mmetsp:Transcript_83577/g.233292  ORF Transcript_83577/g.233292 Transcript_83577/m.233292 type:complete len:426 (+) Transcript_83577:182-1459(+)